VLIVESEHDFVVPHQVIANYREACSRAAFDHLSRHGGGPTTAYR